MKNHVKRSLGSGFPDGDNTAPSDRAAYSADMVRRILCKAYLCFVHDGLLTDLDYKYILNRSSNEGVRFFTDLLPLLGKAFDKALGSGVLELPTHFARKRKAGRTLAVPGKFLVSQFARVFDPNGVLLPDPDAEAVFSIRQVCFYAYKADVPCSPEKELSVIEGFVDTENQLSAFVSTSSFSGGPLHSCDGLPSDPVLAFSSQLISGLFGDFDVDDLRPKHGPGITADIGIPRKWVERPRFINAFTRSGRSQSQLLGLAGSYRWFNPTHCLDDLTAVKPWDAYEGWLKPPSIRIAKVLLVPKDSRGPRLISAEPSYAQYIQQGVLRYMVNRIETHSLTSGHVNFTDQTVNQRLALEGSLNGKWSTLDLKEASDRVSMRLVQLLFSGCPELLAALEAVRSSRTRLPDGRIVDLAKHAPMGSAVCFPVMSLSIWAILASGFRALGVSLEDSLRSIFVYGDDIIVPSALHDVSIRLLENYGLLVNRAKSFRGKGFLESCGCDAFNGVDVTPVRLRSIWGITPEGSVVRDFKIAKPFEQVFVSYVAHGNELAQRGLHASASEAFRRAESILGPLPHVPRSCGIIGIETDVPHHWSVQNHQLSGFRVKSISTDHPISPWDHLRRIESTIGTDCTPAFGVYNLPRRWKLVKGVIPSHLLPVAMYPKWLEKLFESPS